MLSSPEFTEFKIPAFLSLSLTFTNVEYDLEVKETEAKFKEFEPRHKFDMRLKYGWFHFKLNLMF